MVTAQRQAERTMLAGAAQLTPPVCWVPQVFVDQCNERPGFTEHFEVMVPEKLDGKRDQVHPPLAKPNKNQTRIVHTD